MYNYPLKFTFPLFSLTPQFQATMRQVGPVLRCPRAPCS